MKILLQNTITPSYRETRAILQECMLTDIPFNYVGDNDLGKYQSDLKQGDTMAVGSVEFVRKAFSLAGKKEPNIVPYPAVLSDYLYREIQVTDLLGIVGNRVFVKPTELKKFNGFVYNNSRKLSDYDDHDRDQLLILIRQPIYTKFYVSEVVEFLSEHRFYVDGNCVILGSARYDPNDGDAPEPDMAIVKEMISRFNRKTPYALDVGVLKNGTTALVEVNDAWAIGLYGSALSTRDYLNFLWTRWQDIFKSS